MRDAFIEQLLDEQLAQFNIPSFIAQDPISIPHRFSRLQDREIAGFFAASFAWGMRKITLNKCDELLYLMDDAPFDFIQNHQPKDLDRFNDFKHRTINGGDVLYFIKWLKHHYASHTTLEDAFVPTETYKYRTIEEALNTFHEYFFCLPHGYRTEKHISRPLDNSACKKLCMFLRWMVRKDDVGVDFGLWKKIKQNQLVAPLDVHSIRSAASMGLLKETATSWNLALKLTEELKKYCPDDPIKYDFALFGRSELITRPRTKAASMLIGEAY